MRILITGASGFVAPYLVKELKGHDLFLSSRSGLSHLKCDIRSAGSVDRLVKRTRPDAVAHLAGISHTQHVWNDPVGAFETNVLGTHHICASLMKHRPKAKLLNVSSAMVYGPAATKLNERSPIQPATPYGFSKLASEAVSLMYAERGLDVTVVRSFNQIGPGQPPASSCPGLALRISQAQDGGFVSVGSLDRWRDFTDVRDMAVAYRLILEKRPKEKILVLGSGKAVSIRQIAKYFVKLSGKTLKFKVTKDLQRASDPSRMSSDPRLARRVLGWKLHYSLEKTLGEIYADVADVKG